MGRAKPRPVGKKPTSLNPTRVGEPGKLPPTKLREPAPIHSLGVKDKDPVRPVISRPPIPVKPLSQPFDERKVGGLPPRPVKPPVAAPKEKFPVQNTRYTGNLDIVKPEGWAKEKPPMGGGKPKLPVKRPKKK